MYPLRLLGQPARKDLTLFHSQAIADVAHMVLSPSEHDGDADDAGAEGGESKGETKETKGEVKEVASLQRLQLQSLTVPLRSASQAPVAKVALNVHTGPAPALKDVPKLPTVRIATLNHSHGSLRCVQDLQNDINNKPQLPPRSAAMYLNRNR